MEVREQIRFASADEWQEVSPPQIPDFLLFDHPIGRVLRTDSPKPKTFQGHLSGVESS